jgi:hypothetical protein
LDCGLCIDHPIRFSRSNLWHADSGPLFQYLLGVHIFFPLSSRPSSVAFDLVIVFQTLRFGRVAFEPAWLFYPAFILGLLVSFGLILAITVEFNDWDGKYAAFGQNLMMSVLFVAMLLKRQNVKGRSMYIALAKMIGTLLPSILFFLRYPNSPLLNFLYVSIFVFDLIYTLLLYAKHRELGINPWRRV